MPLSDEDKQEIAALISGALTPEALAPAIGKAVNGAVTEKLKSAGVTKEASAAHGTALKELQDKVTAALEAATAKPAPAPEAKAKDGKGKDVVEAAPAFLETEEGKAFQKRLDESEERSKRHEETAAKSKAMAEEQAARQSFFETAAAHKLDATRARIFLNDALASGAAVRDGATVSFKDEHGDTVDLKTGMTAFLKTEAGKLFLPPTGATGSGDRGGGGSGEARIAPPKAQRGDIGRALIAEFTGQSPLEPRER